jgi:hypothetical protein
MSPDGKYDSAEERDHGSVQPDDRRQENSPRYKEKARLLVRGSFDSGSQPGFERREALLHPVPKLRDVAADRID